MSGVFGDRRFRLRRWDQLVGKVSWGRRFVRDATERRVERPLGLRVTSIAGQFLARRREYHPVDDHADANQERHQPWRHQRKHVDFVECYQQGDE